MHGWSCMLGHLLTWRREDCAGAWMIRCPGSRPRPPPPASAPTTSARPMWPVACPNMPSSSTGQRIDMPFQHIQYVGAHRAAQWPAHANSCRRAGAAASPVHCWPSITTLHSGAHTPARDLLHRLAGRRHGRRWYRHGRAVARQSRDLDEHVHGCGRLEEGATWKRVRETTRRQPWQQVWLLHMHVDRPGRARGHATAANLWRLTHAAPPGAYSPARSRSAPANARPMMSMTRQVRQKLARPRRCTRDARSLLSFVL